MKDSIRDELIEEVLASFEKCRSERFREITQSLVKHLHALIEEVGITEKEWRRAINFLTRTGHITDDKRQEFILLSDVLGASMQVIDVNYRKPERATESTVFGPFFVEDSPHYKNGDDLSNGASGEPCYMHGRVLDIEGEPISGAHLEVWQSDQDGFYDVQYVGSTGCKIGVSWRPTKKADTTSGRSNQWPTRYPTTDRLVRYWLLQIEALCARLMCISWSGPSDTKHS